MAALAQLPQKIICVGLNYVDHTTEGKVPVPERPILFAKWPNALVGDGDPIVLPRDLAPQVDFEGELGLVIGRTAAGISVDDAFDAVAGYTCANDISARDLQFSDGQWTRAKSLDTFCPVGPTVVPAAEIADPQNLRIRTSLNGEVMQDESTSEMIFGIAEIISFASQAITLEPGDLILTGTPSGVGAFREPPVWLEPGDSISVEIEGVGTLTNPVQGA